MKTDGNVRKERRYEKNYRQLAEETRIIQSVTDTSDEKPFSEENTSAFL